MQPSVTFATQLSQEQHDMLRALLDSEVLLIGGGDVVTTLY